MYEMGFSGTMIILVTMISRRLLINKLPKIFFVILWLIAILRFLLPFSIPSVFSFYSFLEWKPFSSAMVGDSKEDKFNEFTEDFYKKNKKEDTKVITEKIEEIVSINESIDKNINKKESQKWNNTLIRKEILIFLGKIIWIIGILISTISFFITYIRAYRKFHFSLPVKNSFVEAWLTTHNLRRKISIRQSDCITAPLTYGIFHPVILMPKETDWKNKEQLQYILAHEFIHIQRLDAVIKLLLIAVVCIYWFHPFVWIMYYMANQDIELSCDEAVIHQFGENSKKGYALTLICMEEIKSGLVSIGNHFSQNAAEERIIAIMKNKKSSIVTSIFSIILGIIIFLVFATSTMPTEKINTLKNTSDKLISNKKKQTGTLLETIDVETILSKENQKKLLNIYETYGIYENFGVLYYKDKAIRCFNDQYAEVTENRYGGLNTNYIKLYTYFNIDGEIDLCTIREKQTKEVKIGDIFLEVKNIISMKIDHLALHVPETSLQKIAEKAVYEEDYSTLKDIITYIPIETVDEIVETLVEEEKNTSFFIRYASQDMIKKLAGNAYKENGIKGIRNFLPYLSKESVDLFIREMVKEGVYEGIAEMTLFSSEDLIDHIALELAEEKKNFKNILPYVSKEIREKLEKK